MATRLYLLLNKMNVLNLFIRHKTEISYNNACLCLLTESISDGTYALCTNTLYAGVSDYAYNVLC